MEIAKNTISLPYYVGSSASLTVCQYLKVRMEKASQICTKLETQVTEGR